MAPGPNSRAGRPIAENGGMSSPRQDAPFRRAVRQVLDGRGAVRRFAALAILTCAALLSASCSSRTFVRETDTSGSFHIEATSFRFLAFFEIPFDPKIKAMELARDTWGENLRVVRTYSWPNWGFFQFLNGLIVGVRGTVIDGEYGIPPVTAEGRALYEAAQSRRAGMREADGSALTPTEGARP
jgi:hypothetical protein